MRALITLGVVAVIVVGAVLVVAILARSRKAREDRVERRRHEAFLDHLYKSCLTDADVQPFARTVADEVLNHINPPTSRKRAVR